MIQSFRFHDSGVHYQNKFVRTDKFRAEEAAGRFLYPSWSTQAPGGFWANFLRVGIVGQAGITVFPWQGKLYAFDECSLPYQLEPQGLETVGMSRLGLPDGFTIYAAHSKFDAVSGDWLHFGVLYGPSPKLHITVFRRDGGLKLHRVLAMPRNVYMHDWFVSDRHLILVLHPVEMNYLPVLLGQKSIAEALRWKPEMGNLILVLEREGENPPLLLETTACYMWHSFNAYEKGDEIVADFIGYQNPDHFIGHDPVVSAVMEGRKGEYAYPGAIRRYLINPKGKSIREELIDAGSYEWPQVNEQHRCHRYRFGYMAKTRLGDFFWTLISRIDMRSGETVSYDFGPRFYVTEPVFVPLPGRAYAADEPEPGFILTEVYDSTKRRSFLAVLRAEELSSGPIAIVHLNHHVPFSYHGWWSARA